MKQKGRRIRERREGSRECERERKNRKENEVSI